MPVPFTEAQKFCIAILPHVSRSFALNIRVLKGDLYWAVISAYLFCRIVDTVEDSEHLSGDQRNRLLDEYVALFQEQDFEIHRLRAWRDQFSGLDLANPEHRLIGDCPHLFEVFLGLPESTRKIISDCVIEMAIGMKQAVNRDRAAGALHALETMAELDEYCYYVAGTVGTMLTRLFVGSSRRLTASAAAKMEQLRLSFAQGLQMTNIIKDCREDFDRGWCYVPVELAARKGVPIGEFFQPRNQVRSTEVLNMLIAEAAKHLDDALEYTLLLPRTEVRIRLFNLWSLFFAIRTLRLSWQNACLLDGARKVKISRFEVYLTLAQTSLRVGSNSLLRRHYRKLRRRISAAYRAPLTASPELSI
jgi:farnesyl-diphosphate farnesyltransferase